MLRADQYLAARNLHFETEESTLLGRYQDLESSDRLLLISQKGAELGSHRSHQWATILELIEARCSFVRNQAIWHLARSVWKCRQTDNKLAS